MGATLGSLLPATFGSVSLLAAALASWLYFLRYGPGLVTAFANWHLANKRLNIGTKLLGYLPEEAREKVALKFLTEESPTPLALPSPLASKEKQSKRQVE